jgi:hypothetical protein
MGTTSRVPRKTTARCQLRFRLTHNDYDSAAVWREGKEFHVRL